MRSKLLVRSSVRATEVVPPNQGSEKGSWELALYFKERNNTHRAKSMSRVHLQQGNNQHRHNLTEQQTLLITPTEQSYGAERAQTLRNQ